MAEFYDHAESRERGKPVVPRGLSEITVLVLSVQLRSVRFFELLDQIERDALFRVEDAEQPWLARMARFIERAEQQHIAAGLQQDGELVHHQLVGVRDDWVEIGAPDLMALRNAKTLSRKKLAVATLMSAKLRNRGSGEFGS